MSPRKPNPLTKGNGRTPLCLLGFHLSTLLTVTRPIPPSRAMDARWGSPKASKRAAPVALHKDVAVGGSRQCNGRVSCGLVNRMYSRRPGDLTTERRLPDTSTTTAPPAIRRPHAGVLAGQAPIEVGSKKALGRMGSQAWRTRGVVVTPPSASSCSAADHSRLPFRLSSRCSRLESLDDQPDREDHLVETYWSCEESLHRR